LFFNVTGLAGYFTFPVYLDLVSDVLTAGLTADDGFCGVHADSVAHAKCCTYLVEKGTPYPHGNYTALNKELDTTSSVHGCHQRHKTNRYGKYGFK
jgi:hypothetical protein